MTSKLSLTIIVIVALFLALFDYPHAWDVLAAKIPHAPKFTITKPFRLGLDLLGGSHLEYEADLSGIKDQTSAEAMSGVRDVIERRVNAFGVAEPLVEIEGTNRLVVELAGIKDVNQAIAQIGQTPFLEFRELGEGKASQSFVATGLSGKNLKNARLEFDTTTGQPQVSLELDDEGAKLFAAITKRNLGKIVGIFLDRELISYPVVRSEITTGKATISGGGMTIKNAKELVARLNAGALPVPVKLIAQSTIGASLGAESLTKSLRAGMYALLLVGLFMILFYRLPGLAAVLALLMYIAVVLALYKLIPVTLTLSGIAGFILSLGIAVDANVLIFARLREELAAGRTLPQAVEEGFRRAWYSIRDSHVTTILGAVVLYMFTTSIVKGFAFTLGIGVFMSLFSSVIVTRAIMNRLTGPWFSSRPWLF